MANDVDGFKLLLVHGTKKYNLNLQLDEEDAKSVLTVGHLSALVADVTQVPAANQKLIFKGCSLKNRDDSLTSLGLKPGSKVMLLGKRPEPVDGKEVLKMEATDKDVKKSEEKLAEIARRLEGIDKGFLDGEMKELTQKDLSKQLHVLSEELMKLLECLDALQFDEDNKGGRIRRKNLVDKIQVLMDQTERFSQLVKEMITKYSL